MSGCKKRDQVLESQLLYNGRLGGRQSVTHLYGPPVAPRRGYAFAQVVDEVQALRCKGLAQAQRRRWGPRVRGRHVREAVPEGSGQGVDTHLRLGYESGERVETGHRGGRGGRTCGTVGRS